MTLCKPHNVCISLWPMGWDDVRTRAGRWQVKRFGGRFASIVLWYNFVLTFKHMEKKLYTDIDKYTCCSSILSLVQFLFSFILFYVNI